MQCYFLIASVSWYLFLVQLHVQDRNLRYHYQTHYQPNLKTVCPWQWAKYAIFSFQIYLSSFISTFFYRNTYYLLARSSATLVLEHGVDRVSANAIEQ